MELQNHTAEEWKKDYNEFFDATRQFYEGEMDAKRYKGISGGFGSYAQRGGEASMLRLRMAGGRMDPEKLAFIVSSIERWSIDRVHITTCQTLQLHDLSQEAVCALAVEALEYGIVTRGGGGDFPRNVTISPLAGVEQGEYFDVSPYALAAGEYLMGLIHGPKLPRKLKVAFSNTPENLPHATFRDLGFTANEDGTFDVYSAGGLGGAPKFGVRVAEHIKPDQVLYYIQAMHDLFCARGNYENRAKARSRYMQDTLGGPEGYRGAFQEMLKAVYASGRDLTIPAEQCAAAAVKKAPSGELPEDSRIIAQKQPGLCAVYYHPIGGSPEPSFFARIQEVIRGMDQVELRLAPDESIYIINCTGDEAARVLEATADGAKTVFETSVACIGASICQQGLRDSQSLLRSLVEMERREGFADGVLPQIHISGCPSSCGTHQIGVLGLQGAAKKADGVMQSAFALSWNGCDWQGKERMGERLGVILEKDLNEFLCRLGHAVTDSGLLFEEWSRRYPDGVKETAEPFL